MRDLSEYYTTEYLTESAPAQNLKGVKDGQDNTLQPHPDVDAAVEYDDLEFDLGDELTKETYYAGGDEGDSRNKVTPKIKNRKKSLKKESFNDLVKSVLVSEMDDFEADYEGEADYEDDYDMEDEGTVEVSASVIRDIIGQLEGLVGGVEDEYAEDEYVDDEGFEDDFAEESWDGGAGDQRIKGDYSGKARGQGGSNLNDKGRAKVNAKPNNTEGSEGDERLGGTYDGKAKRDRGTTHLKGGKNSNKSSGKTKYKKTPNPEEDLFGV